MPDNGASVLPSFEVYFRSLALVEGRNELSIENEVGSRSFVDLSTKKITIVSETQVKPKPAVVAKPKPKS